MFLNSEFSSIGDKNKKLDKKFMITKWGVTKWGVTKWCLEPLEYIKRYKSITSRIYFTLKSHLSSHTSFS